MFAPQNANPQTEAIENPTSRPALQRSTLSGHGHGRDPIEHALFLQRSIGNQATMRLLAQRVPRPDGKINVGQSPAVSSSSPMLARAPDPVEMDLRRAEIELEQLKDVAKDYIEEVTGHRAEGAGRGAWSAAQVVQALRAIRRRGGVAAKTAGVLENAMIEARTKVSDLHKLGGTTGTPPKEPTRYDSPDGAKDPPAKAPPTEPPTPLTNEGGAVQDGHSVSGGVRAPLDINPGLAAGARFGAAALDVLGAVGALKFGYDFQKEMDYINSLKSGEYFDEFWFEIRAFPQGAQIILEGMPAIVDKRNGTKLIFKDGSVIRAISSKKGGLGMEITLPDKSVHKVDKNGIVDLLPDA